jgi:hypothetical protein
MRNIHIFWGAVLCRPITLFSGLLRQGQAGRLLVPDAEGLQFFKASRNTHPVTQPNVLKDLKMQDERRSKIAIKSFGNKKETFHGSKNLILVILNFTFM